IPAAIENQIGEHNAPKIKAKLIAEAANGPTSPEADRILYDKDVFMIPDILCNAGGVTVSYFEWVQDLQNLFWREATINARLKEVMVKSFNDVLQMSLKHKVHMRTAAYMVAVARVAEATLTRGIYPSTRAVPPQAAQHRSAIERKSSSRTTLRPPVSLW